MRQTNNKVNRLLRRLQFTNEMRSTNEIVIMPFFSLLLETSTKENGYFSVLLALSYLLLMK